MPPALTHIDTWIFDLDNTLYPARCNLFALIDQKMGAYIQTMFACDATEARRIQKGYFVEYGTTMNGLMAEHGIDPDGFLDFVHDIDLSRLSPDPVLRELLNRLPGRKLVFTNGDASYATRVLAALGLDEVFDGLHDIRACAYVPKPDSRAYDSLCDALQVNPDTSFFAEDMARNLRPAKGLGMATLWINNGSEQAKGNACPSFVDFETHDLSDWLNTLA